MYSQGLVEVSLTALDETFQAETETRPETRDTKHRALRLIALPIYQYLTYKFRLAFA